MLVNLCCLGVTDMETVIRLKRLVVMLTYRMGQELTDWKLFTSHHLLRHFSIRDKPDHQLKLHHIETRDWLG